MDTRPVNKWLVHNKMLVLRVDSLLKSLLAVTHPRLSCNCTLMLHGQVHRENQGILILQKAAIALGFKDSESMSIFQTR